MAAELGSPDTGVSLLILYTTSLLYSYEALIAPADLRGMIHAELEGLISRRVSGSLMYLYLLVIGVMHSWCHLNSMQL